MSRQGERREEVEHELSRHRSWKQADTLVKQSKLDAQREDDAHRITQRAEARRTMRDDRFDRLVQNLAASSGVVAEIGQDLRKTEAEEFRRRQVRHDDWEEAVFQPVQSHLMQHFNTSSPSSRSVSFPEAGQGKRSFGAMKDPIKREMAERAQEEAFDRDASQFLSRTVPSRMTDIGQTSPVSLLKARSRTTLDAASWGQLKLQALPYGSFAQTAELGPVRAWKRPGVAPDENDGVPVAGKRTVRSGPHSVRHGDLGQLRPDNAVHRGEAAKYKTWTGASSAAPAQDHYTFRTDGVAADMEFPLGKRVFPQWP